MLIMLDIELALKFCKINSTFAEEDVSFADNLVRLGHLIFGVGRRQKLMAVINWMRSSICSFYIREF